MTAGGDLALQGRPPAATEHRLRRRACPGASVQMITGRGYLSHNGEVEIVQVAMPDGTR